MKALNLALALFCLLFFLSSDIFALNASEVYTINIQRMNSDGTLTALSLNINPAVADADGKITFSATGIPDNSSCNFMVINIVDSSSTTQRRSIVPCPAAGGTLPAGVSPLTKTQADALLAAAASAGTDDPILMVFGFAAVRSTNLTAAELSVLAGFMNQGINDSGGFLDYLTTQGVTAAQLVSYRSAIVSKLADAASGYSKLIKDSVDAASDSAALNKRGDAARALFDILVEAATTAGFLQDMVLSAFYAMGAIVVPLIDASGDLSAVAKQMVGANIGGGIQSLKADKSIEKYAAAMTTLGGSASDVATYTTAANTLLSSMQSAFRVFEQVFTGSETSGEVSTANSTFGTAMQTAFSQFMTDVAASDARITTMISNINTALGEASGLTGDNFKFYKSGGTSVNWSINMVVLTEWVSSIVTAGGSLTYTRDTIDVPDAMTWLEPNCPSAQTNQDDNITCRYNGETGIDKIMANCRSAFGGVPASYAAILSIEEDVQIREFTRFAAQAAAGTDFDAHHTLETNFQAGLNTTIKGNIGGTTDGSTPISDTQKGAVVTLIQPPQF